MSSRLPGVQSQVLTNPLLTSGITSVRKPIILGVGDVKVLVENERLIKGASAGSDPVANTIYGSSTAFQLANIIRAGNAPNSSDYDKTTDFTVNGSGEVDWASAVAEPTTGQEYYITYYKSIDSTLDLAEYTSEGDVISAYGSTILTTAKQFATNTVASTASDTVTWANTDDNAIIESVVNDANDEWYVTFVSGPNSNVTRTVTAYTSGSGAFTVSPAFSNTISVGEIFLLESKIPVVNTLTTGTLLALRNGSQSAIVGQLDNTSFSNKLVPTSSEYGTSLNTHLETLKSDIEMPYFLVPMLPDNDSTFASNADAQTNAINPIWNHCKLMSAPENKGERTCVTGFLAGTSVANYKAYGPTYFSTRMAIVAPGDLEFSGVTGHTLNGSIGAAALAGKICSVARVSQSILNEGLVGVVVAANFYNAVQQRDLTSKGISFFVSEAGLVKVVAGKTTDTTSADTEDLAVVAIADYVKKTTREEVGNTFIGAPITSRLPGAIAGKMSSIFERLINDQVLDEYKDITVKQNVTEPRQIDVTASIKPVYSMWFADINMQFYV